MCAGGEKDLGACQGDSGSALVVGVSFCCIKNLPLKKSFTFLNLSPGTDKGGGTMGLAWDHQLESRVCARRFFHFFVSSFLIINNLSIVVI